MALRPEAHSSFEAIPRALIFWLVSQKTSSIRCAAETNSGRVTSVSDFSMLIATRLNFLRRQRALLSDPRHREWARREIAEAVRIMPTPHYLACALAEIHSSAQRR